MRLTRIVTLLVAAVLIASCGGDDEPFCVTYEYYEEIGGQEPSRTDCREPVATCDSVAAADYCSDESCMGALYDDCGAPYMGFGCSSISFGDDAEVSITCVPDDGA